MIKPSSSLGHWYAFLFAISAAFCISACQSAVQEKNVFSAVAATTAPLPDSIAQAIDSIVWRLAEKNNCRMAIKAGVPGSSAHYSGFDGRDSSWIDDFSIPYEIGSTTKMFTAASIIQLVERGELSLETPFLQVLPNDTLYDGMLVINGIDYIDSVKIFNLLNHTSGLPDYFVEDSDEQEIAKNADPSLRFSFYDLVALSRRSNKDRFKPGSRFEYSNINYILLGQIIEKVSGQSYPDYVQKHILDPLGLTHTYLGTRNPPDEKVQGHFRGKEVEMPYTMAGAAGEIISTLDDMFLFIDGWYKGDLFEKEETRKRVIRDYYNDMGMGLSYGLGAINYQDKSWGHAGETFGIQAYSAAMPNGYRFTLYIDDAEGGSVWLPATTLSSLLSGQEL